MQGVESVWGLEPKRRRKTRDAWRQGLTWTDTSLNLATTELPGNVYPGWVGHPPVISPGWILSLFRGRSCWQRP
jgi:hypothetical protein